MPRTFSVLNGAAPGVAAPVALATGSAIKTMLQLATSSLKTIDISAYWFEFNATVAAAAVKCELLRHGGGPQTGLVAYVAADIARVTDPTGPASQVQLGTALSGYGAGAAEVTPTTTPVSPHTHFIPPTSGLFVQIAKGRELQIPVSAFARLRTTAGATVDCISGVQWEE